MKTITVTLTLLLFLTTGLIAACNGDDSADETPTPAATDAATETATAEPSATQSLEDEIGEAYLDYWEAYGAALLELDVSLAEDHAVGEELDRIRDEIQDLAIRGLAARVRVEHNFAVVEASENSATVVDNIVNNSFLVDAETKEPPEAEGTGDRFQDTFSLDKIDGRWVVVKSTRVQVES